MPIEIETHGVASRWAPMGVQDDLAFRKIDLIDLVEETTQSLHRGVARTRQSADDDGAPHPPSHRREHHVASLSATEQQLFVSREYGAEGHVGEQWTLQRIADCGVEATLDARVLSRTYKHVYDDAMAASRVLEAERELLRVPPIRFNGAREASTKASRLGIAQAYSLEHLERSEREHNFNSLSSAAVLLLNTPTLLCEVHGRTSTPVSVDADLATHLGLLPTSARPVMDKLAELRALAVVEGLVSRGVPRGQLRATFEGCTDEQAVRFIPRMTFDAPLRRRPRVANEADASARVRAVFARYDGDRSGRIDHLELRRAIGALGLQTDASQAEAVLRKYDADGNGELDLAEFAQLVLDLEAFQAGNGGRGGAPAHRAAPSLPAAELRAVFDRHDRDGSGAIEMGELRGALDALGLATDLPQAHKVLRKYDKDGSGALEYAEFKRLVEELRVFLDGHRSWPPAPAFGRTERVRAAFERFDGNQSGDLDATELRGALAELGLEASSAQATAILRKYDDDLSNRLDLEEFKKLVGELRAFQAERSPPKRKPPSKRSGGTGNAVATATATAIAVADPAGLPQPRKRAPPKRSSSTASTASAAVAPPASSSTAPPPAGKRKPPPSKKPGLPKPLPPAAVASSLGAAALLQEPTLVIFRKFDADGNGSIDARELRKAANALGVKTDSAQAAQMLAKYDDDGNLKLSYSEFAILIEQLRAFQATRAVRRPPPKKKTAG